MKNHKRIMIGIGTPTVQSIKLRPMTILLDVIQCPRRQVSWRVGGASSAELAAMAAFARDPSLEIIRTSHVEEYGKGRRAPADAIIDFHGDDPQAGPLLRYTVVKPQDPKKRDGSWRDLPRPMISSDADRHVIPFRSRTGASHQSHRGTPLIDPDYSPVLDLSKYECPESEEDYRQRMVENAVALVFISLLSLAGLYLVNAIAHS